MSTERLKVLSDHLAVLSELHKNGALVYRELEETNRAIHNAMFPQGDDEWLINLKRHINYHDVVVLDGDNFKLMVKGTDTEVWDVLQELRNRSREEVCKKLGLTEIQVSNVLCFAANVVIDGAY